MANLLRIAEIEAAIASGKYPNRSDLARQLEVSTKTIARDIDELRLQGAPVEYDAVENGYYFTDERYRFSQLEIKAKEIFSMFLAERALDQYKGTPLHDSLSAVFDRLKTYVPGQESINTQWLSEKVIFHSLPNVKINPDTWATLMAAIENDNYATFSYQSPRGKSQRKVAPLYLINYQGQWILLCFSETDKGYRNFALSRMSNIKASMDLFPRHYDTDISEELAERFGIQFTESPVQFEITFNKAVAMIIEERTWSKDQTIKHNRDGSITLTMTSTCVNDVKNWVLSWGSMAQLIKPHTLAEEIKNELRNTLDLYGKKS